MRSWISAGWERLSKAGMILVDLLILNGAVFAAFGIRYLTDPAFNALVNIPPFLRILPFFNLAALVMMDAFGVQKYYRKTLFDIVQSCTALVILLFAFTVTLAFFVRGFAFPRAVLLLTPAIQLAFLLPWKAFCVRGWNRNRPGIALIIGTSEECVKLKDKVSRAQPGWGMEVHFTLPPEEVLTYPKTLRKVRDVFICASVQDAQRIAIMDRCIADRKVVYVVPEISEISIIGARQVAFDDLLTLMVDRLNLTFEQRMVKRVFDLVIAGVGLVLLAPALWVLCLLVRRDSPGPAFYKQERVTIGERRFWMVKFRTMRQDAENTTGPVLAEKDDPRLTNMGRWIRRHRLDELPQLWNVLKGEMSLVGPRSERPFFVEQFKEDIPQYRYRTSVKAGITGYAQVLGSYDTLPEDKLRYDLLYIRNYSLILDVEILCKTVGVMLRGVGK